MKLLFDLGEYSLDSEKVSGIGIRAAELAETLSNYHSVYLYATDDKNPIYTGEAIIFTQAREWKMLLKEVDVVIFFDMGARSRLEEAVNSNVLIVTENAPPIEHLEYPRLKSYNNRNELYQQILSTYRRQLEVSAHFLCRANIERITLIANLCLMGRISYSMIDESRTLEKMISLVPIGYSANSAKIADAIQAKSISEVLWTGGLWDFYEPEIYIDAIRILKEKKILIDTTFLYAKKIDDNAGKLDSLSRKILNYKLDDRIHLAEFNLAHHQRDAYIKGALALVCLGKKGIENETCVRLRVRDSRLYGIPLIVDPYGATSRELMEDGLAIVLQETTAENLSEELVKLKTNNKSYARAAHYDYDISIVKFLKWLKMGEVM